MTQLRSVLIWAMRRPVSLPTIIVHLNSEVLPPVVLRSGGENVVTLPLISAGDQCSINSRKNVKAALVLVISNAFRTSARMKFCL